MHLLLPARRFAFFQRGAVFHEILARPPFFRAAGAAVQRALPYAGAARLQPKCGRG